MTLVTCPECGGRVSGAAAACPHCGHPIAVGAMPTLAAGRPPRAAAAEQTLWEGSPSIKSLALDIAATALFALVIAIGVYLVYRPALHLAAGVSRQAARAVADYEPGLRLAAIAFTLVVVGGRVARLVSRLLGLRSNHYRLSNQRLLIESGVLSKTIIEIDLRTVDEITFHQSFAARLLGVGEIAVISSEPGPRDARTVVRLVGIPDPRDVRERLRSAAYDATGSQVFLRST